MLTAIQKEWAELLRSGEFKQGKGALHNAGNGCRCCLGVAIEVCKRHGIIFHEEKRSLIDDEHGVNTAMFYDGFYCCLPKAAIDFIGLSTDLGTFLGGALSEINDYAGMTFEQIADLIESEPEELFITPAEG